MWLYVVICGYMWKFICGYMWLYVVICGYMWLYVFANFDMIYMFLYVEIYDFDMIYMFLYVVKCGHTRTDSHAHTRTCV